MNVCCGHAVEEKFWKDIHKELDSFIQKRIRNPEDISDLRQEICLRIHNNIDSLLKTEKIKSWIYQIARNAIIDFYRKQKPMAVPIEKMTLPVDTEEEQDIEKEVAGWLPDFIKTLPQRYQDPIRLTEMEGLTQQQMSRKLGLKLATAKSRVQRGRRLIQKMLLDCCRLEFDRRGRIVSYHKKKKVHP